MPSWNRREKPDYRHLRDVTDEQALANAIRSPTYGEATSYRLLAGFQDRLVRMWGDRDVIGLDELVPVHEELRARDPGFFGNGRNWQGAFLHDAVGNLVGWGLRLEVLEEVQQEGGRAFRMVRRDPLFERMGNNSWRRIDASKDRSARGAAQREAYRVKHAEKLAPEIARLVDELCDRGAAVPDSWFTWFPEPLAPLKGLVERVADARPTFASAHRGMHIADQRSWLHALAFYLNQVPPRPALEPASAPDEDVEALAGLV